MFRKFLSKSTPVVKQLSSQIKNQNKIRYYSSCTVKLNNGTETAQEVEYRKYKEAVNELSENEDSLSPNLIPPADLLAKWNITDCSDLSTHELEQLANANYKGIEGKIRQNFQRAAELYKIASDAGSLNARYSYAICLKDGVGVEKHPEMAFDMIDYLASEKDHAAATFSLAVMLSNGEGTQQNDEGALHYFKAASKLGVVPALYNIGNFYSAGRGGVLQSDKNAILYYEYAVSAGDPSAKFTLGTWLYTGRTIEKDRVRAFQLQKEAADMGHTGAMFNTAVAYMAGEGVTQNVDQSIVYYEHCIKRGLSQAAVNLGNMYRTGLKHTNGELKIDLNKAKKIFSQFSEKDNDCKELLEMVNSELAGNAAI